MPMKRRNALKVLGGSVLTATTYGSTAAASEKPDYVGYTYKPNDGEVFGTVTAEFDRSPEEIGGKLSFEGEEAVKKLKLPRNTVQFTGVERLSKEQPKQGPSDKSLSKFRTDLGDIASVAEVKISSVDGGGYTGYLRTPNDEKVAYSLVHRSEYDVDRLLELINSL